uniref:acid phosphatase n=1 Tax=Angiostrongylus cantonensis TaxID=6313 RepID=A0A0K0DQA9_ANGCA
KYLSFIKIVSIKCQVWRHGDRSPTRTFPTDPIQEADWTFGGGGFGQLSPKGMAQHLKFGKLLRKLYVDTGFLSNSYSSREVYIRSTDVNRTIISAMSNMLGMYGQNDGSSHAGVDYPNETGWPVGYVPIPVHVVDFRTDHVRYLLPKFAVCCLKLCS